jgi:DNA-binding NtrC family response regulator
MPPTLLVVDDDEVLSRILVRVLERFGYRVVSALSTGQALRLAAEHHPCLALLDLCLPDGSGIELGRELRKNHPDLPMILMTAYPVELREHSEWRDTFVSFLTKPLDLGGLRATIAQCLAVDAVDAAAQKRPLTVG